MTSISRAAVLGVAIGMTACASAPIRPADQLALADADRRVTDGCYECLLEAREIYAGVAVGNARSIVLPRLFEIDLLIALRQKELALDAEATIDQVRAYLSELPVEIEASRYLDIVDWLPYDSAGWPRHESQERWRARGPTFRTPAESREFRDARLNFLSAGVLSLPFRHYLALAFSCDAPARRFAADEDEASDPVWPELTPASPPLLRYRMAQCTRDDEGLAGVRAEVPGFREVSLFRGRIRYARQEVTDGLVFAREAFQHLPDSPAVTYLLASLYRVAGDCRAALARYGETLAIKPTHEEALLGQTVCQSTLGQHVPAIGTATQLIDRQAFNFAEAYYWRAWNQYQRQELELARADVERGRTLLYNASLLTLAGMIEYAQQDLDPAEADLAEAKRLDPKACTAMWYGALVGLDRERWGPAASAFAEAMDCYDASARDSERRRNETAANPDLDPAVKAAQVAGLEAAIAEDRSQQSASAANAAINFFRDMNFDDAAGFTELAARDPARADIVRELRERLAAVDR